MLCEAHLSQYFQVNMWKSNESSFPPWSLFHLVYPSDFTGPHLRSHFLRPFLFLTPSPSSSVCHMSSLVDSTLQICPPLFPLYCHSRGAFYKYSGISGQPPSTSSCLHSLLHPFQIILPVYKNNHLPNVENLNSWF